MFDGGRMWRVDSTNFPISTTMTGVVLDLEPGGLRELHWHPTADEWQYVIEGDVSVTMFGSHGRYRAETLSKGDVGYIPQGYGHSIENVGTETCRILIGFNSGVYAKIDLWVRKDNYVPLKWVMFDKAGQPVKTLISKEIQRHGGRWFITGSRMTDNATGRQTELMLEKIDRREDIPLESFSVRAIEKG